jgi:hypothetical protein
LKKPIPNYFFTSLLSGLSIEYLVTLGNLLSIEFLKPQIWLYATLGRWTWLPRDLRNKVLKLPVNYQTRSAPKPWNVYDS